MEMKINLEDKEEAKKQIKTVQKTIDELLEVCNDQKAQLQENLKNIDEAEGMIVTLQKANVDMAEAIKNIHIVLGAKTDLWKGDEQINVLMNSLSKFVMSSGAIKAGVINNDKKKSM